MFEFPLIRICLLAFQSYPNIGDSVPLGNNSLIRRVELLSLLLCLLGLFCFRGLSFS